jgi:hypothetical protein
MRVTVAIDQQKFDYLDEHLPYMLGSVRYDFNKLSQQLFFRDWNASFQSFSVNARNLVEFLNNGDKRNFKASDFVEGFRFRKGDIQGPLRKLDEQVFHLGKARPRDSDGKFDFSAAKAVLDWIEEGMQSFLEDLSPENKKAWNSEKADPRFDPVLAPSTGPTGPASPLPASPFSASSSILVSTTHTSSVSPDLKAVRIFDDNA